MGSSGPAQELEREESKRKPPSDHHRFPMSRNATSREGIKRSVLGTSLRSAALVPVVTFG
jgi:hypothetical protein